MDIKIVFFDIDSTLTAAANMPVVDSAIKAIKMLQEKGIKVVICSGRPPHSMKAVDGVIDADYYIGCNGHIVADENKNNLFVKRIEKDKFDRINKFCIDNKYGLIWKFEDNNYVYQDSKEVQMVLPGLGTHAMGFHPEEDKLPAGGALVCQKEGIQRFQENFSNDVDIVDGGYILYDICVKDVNKATGIEWLLNHLDLSTDQAMAFGDSDNDIEMIKYVGFGVAMGNGYQTLKNVADYVTDDAGDDGIFNALKKFEII